ncbi:6,7-dimethyl-8-ribityllumazine synthase [Pantoea sp. Mhis]|uniref:6,7-dimethyl-8-ribityllumazine synthase n=1 Tax=Pantoea sp. Mhis TaxID=2576759 RepID=UPI001357C759|nr:6,7-dimethyl-8-ribityllumazine synthase [Pantoea sp. Mhis]MXP56234.1 6,7-dimethyl-8-ribityllumazine synthase [Pantoea sp. Mhis]
MKVIEANIVAPDSNIAIVTSRFNNFIGKNLLNGAIDTLKRLGQVKEQNITTIWVPGAYELPLITRVLARSSKYHAIIALGVIIRGDTAHFKYIANSVSMSISNTSMYNEIPISFGVLTTKNIEQAMERAGSKAGNKGIEAALTALEMINILQAIKE